MTLLICSSYWHWSLLSKIWEQNRLTFEITSNISLFYGSFWQVILWICQHTPPKHWFYLQNRFLKIGHIASMPPQDHHGLYLGYKLMSIFNWGYGGKSQGVFETWDFSCYYLSDSHLLKVLGMEPRALHAWQVLYPWAITVFFYIV